MTPENGSVPPLSWTQTGVQLPTLKRLLRVLLAKPIRRFSTVGGSAAKVCPIESSQTNTKPAAHVERGV